MKRRRILPMKHIRWSSLQGIQNFDYFTKLHVPHPQTNPHSCSFRPLKLWWGAAVLTFVVNELSAKKKLFQLLPTDLQHRSKSHFSSTKVPSGKVSQTTVKSKVVKYQWMEHHSTDLNSNTISEKLLFWKENHSGILKNSNIRHFFSLVRP